MHTPAPRSPDMPAPRSLSSGVLFGAAAGALWGLVFLAPQLTPTFSPLLLSVGRYVAYGVLSAILVASRWRSLSARVSRREWIELVSLSLTGNLVYYVLLSSAVQTGGIAMTSLVIGFLPVAVTIVGSRDSNAVPLMRLVPSLLLCAAGALCIGWQALATPGPLGPQLVGLACAVGALASWATFAVGNSRALARLEDVSSHEWSLLLGLVTGALSLVLVPVAFVLGGVTHSPLEWTRFFSVSIGVAVIASVLGNALRNRMSRILPLTLVGQMILFETLFALVYGFAWERRWPRPLELGAFVLVVSSVLSCIAAHRPRAG